MNVHKSIHSCCVFALVQYSYDYHEFEIVEVVSFDKQKLVDEYQKGQIIDLNYSFPLVSKDEHENLQQNEIAHFCIEPLKFLE